METEERIKVYLDTISGCCDVDYWRFDARFNLEYSTSTTVTLMQQLLFERKNQKERIIEYGGRESLPLISSTTIGLLWATVFEKDNGKLKKIHVLGPLFTSDISMRYIEEEVGKHQMSYRFRQRVITCISLLPVITATRFFPYVQMLHYCATGQRISTSEINYQTTVSRKIGRTVDWEEQDSTEQYAGVYAAELELFKMVEDGNTNYRTALSNAAQKATMGKTTYNGDPIRKNQMVAVKFITLTIRAAIRGGLPPATAYAVGDFYESAVADCQSVSDIPHIINTMYDDFIHRVKKCKEQKNISKPIQVCCDYIDMHLTDNISLSNLADVAGYTDYYLTRKFKKEMNISIWDYINRAKVERAKILLADEDMTIQDISDTLNYCSRSYFSETFLRHTGQSPTDYRRNELRM